MIFLAADHAGYKMKEYIRHKLASEKIAFEDFGTFSEERVDYPGYAKQVARAVLKHNGKGILFCRSGEGMAITANRLKGIRCAEVWSREVTIETRNDNDANMISIPSGYVSDEVAWEIVRAFLSTTFSHEERHKRRIRQIDEKQ